MLYLGWETTTRTDAYWLSSDENKVGLQNSRLETPEISKKESSISVWHWIQSVWEINRYNMDLAIRGYLIRFYYVPCMIHSKNTRVSVTRKRVHWGPNSIPGQRWPGYQSTWREIWPRAGSIWPHYLSIWLISGSSLTRNGVWPQWTLFRVTADPGVFRVYSIQNMALLNNRESIFSSE